jgi:hypothetical protein
MLVSALLAVAVAIAPIPPDTNPPHAPPTAPDTVAPIPFAVQMPADTVHHRPRPRAIEYDDAYYTRLDLHRELSYTIYPLYVAQYLCGRELWNKGRDAPTWAKTGHRVFATALVGVFSANTVTGLWNLWDSRHDPDHRVLRTVHAITMLAADGAFSYAGSTLATQAQNSLAKRRLHRTITISAMGVTALSSLIMTFYNR